MLQKLEEIRTDYFNSETVASQGVPTVQYLAEQLHLSAGYLSDILRFLTGQDAQQYIQGMLIEKAKEKLSMTELTVSEIAYELGAIFATAGVLHQQFLCRLCLQVKNICKGGILSFTPK